MLLVICTFSEIQALINEIVTKRGWMLEDKIGSDRRSVFDYELEY